MKEAYSILGKYFEYLNVNCDYIKWSQYVHIMLQKYCKLPLTNGLDIGCGNGYFSRFFSDLGVEMLAIDSSESMLQVARQKAAACGHTTKYIQANIVDFIAHQAKNFAIAINDCFNYIPPDKIAIALQNIADSLKLGGIFIFDISTYYKMQYELDGQVFCDERENVAYIWKNTLKERYLDIVLTFFIKEENGLFKREQERHRQFIYSKKDLIDKLQTAGFKVLHCSGHLGDKKDKLRANFICEKV